MRRNYWLAGGAAALVIVVLVGVWLATRPDNGRSRKELNLLCWTGYEERDMLEPFEKEYGVKVNYKTFVGGDEMFALFTQSKGQYDVVVVDPEYIAKLHAAGRLAELRPSDYNFADYFEPFQHFPLCWIDDKLFAVLIRFGANGLVYNSRHLTADDVRSYKILWNPKVKGKVGIWDWYLPSMGVLSRSLGNDKPYDIDEEQFAALERRLFALRPQVAAIHPQPSEMLAALANEQTWIVPAGGEWVASLLEQQGKPIDWTIPEEGGIMWVETLVIANDAPHPEAAKLYIQWMQTPKAQALLSQRKAYNSNVPNEKAYELLTPEQRDTLKVHDAKEALALINRLSVRRLPVNQRFHGASAIYRRPHLDSR
jgi:spermidine/putrescine transport system substrate-binding protein